MVKANEIQTAIFQAIKHRLPENYSFVHEIAELLGISYDSAYRRIRGDKPLTLDELILLNEKFGLSIDTFLNVETNNVGNYDEEEPVVVKGWIKWRDETGFLVDISWVL